MKKEQYYMDIARFQAETNTMLLRLNAYLEGCAEGSEANNAQLKDTVEKQTNEIEQLKSKLKEKQQIIDADAVRIKEREKEAGSYRGLYLELKAEIIDDMTATRKEVLRTARIHKAESILYNNMWKKEQKRVSKLNAEKRLFMTLVKDRLQAGEYKRLFNDYQYFLKQRRKKKKRPAQDKSQ